MMLPSQQVLNLQDFKQSLNKNPEQAFEDV